MQNWTHLLKQAGINQEELAVALDKSPSVISALVNNVKGKSAAGKKLQKKALDYLQARARGSESVFQGRDKSELSGVELRESAAQSEIETWKRRAKDAEEKLHNLRTMLRAAIELSAPHAAPDAAADVLEQLVQQAEGGRRPAEKSTPTPGS